MYFLVVNGRLPLIKSSVIEYPNGDEVTASFVYERLEKHCSTCQRLDHEVKDCLELKAQKRRALAAEIGKNQLLKLPEKNDVDSSNQRIINDTFRFSATRENSGSCRETSPHSYHQSSRHARPSTRHLSRLENRDNLRSQSRSNFSSRSYSQNYGSHARNHHGARHSNLLHKEVNRAPPSPRNLSNREGNSVRSFYREIRRPLPEDIQDQSFSSKKEQSDPTRGVPQGSSHPTIQKDIPLNVFEEALGEVRDAMVQYTSHGDPTESAARRERLRLAEEQGELETTAMQVAQTAMIAARSRTHLEENLSPPSCERIPAFHRLGPLPEESSIERFSQERLPALQRLGPSPDLDGSDDLPILGQGTKTVVKRKPGRPPGSKKVQISPKTLAGASSRKRKPGAPDPPLDNPQRKGTQMINQSVILFLRF
ncbi:hypothetical protein Bca4012_069091 [Brassica carinata]